MKKVLFLALLSFAYVFAGLNVSDFQAYVDSLVPGSRLGLSVRSVKTGEELASIGDDKKFTPASTLKTLTTATALHYLPLDYEPKTFVSLDGTVENRTFVGTVTVRGQGDPNFSGRFYNDAFYVLNSMADSIKSLGVDSIRGLIVLDSSYYKGPWKADPEHWRKHFYDSWYGAEIAPLGFNDNCALLKIKPGKKEGDLVQVEILPDVGYIEIKNSLKTAVAPKTKKKRKKKLKWEYSLDPARSVVSLSGSFDIQSDSAQFVFPVRNPVLYFGAAFRYALKNRGVALTETPVEPDSNEVKIQKKFEFSAAPLLSLLDEINQKSQNYHAETLLRNLGAEQGGEGSVDGGRRMEKKFLAEIGIDTADFEVYDGSGLSFRNRLKLSSETKLLRHMARHPKASYYIASLASPGVGSGSKRMKDLKYPWLTRFKTGYIAEVHGLAGYIYTMDGDTLATAMYLNETGKNPDAVSKDVLDTLWLRLLNQANDNYASLMEMKSMWLEAENIGEFNERLEFFSGKLIGRPYLLGPMGESYLGDVDTKPLVYMDSVDCMTYLEHALAMALAPSPDSIFDIHQKIRYFDGQIDFSYRKHYLLADWVENGGFAKVLPQEGDTVIKRVLPKNDFFKAKKLPYLVNGAPAEDPTIDLRYLPYDKAVEQMSKPYEGPLLVLGIAFISKNAKVDAYHTGFVVCIPGEPPRVRHASSLKKKVVELPLVEYLKTSKGKLPGITLFSFFPPAK
ncbi:MAG: D-alanyl-D-alanine carboxypeptidase/D-alanyl-D-alanine-endopeptidase [Fibrobacter sp.]|nr:D-alanyl-D-alanine carboxypeptidase/D-alanyl-D-alanine-endopeptidase [Fibrobacter sp.]